MGCQSEVFLEKNLTFSINTHDPGTAGAADAVSAPTYRVYETTTGTAILNGTMAKLDDTNTTGLYAATIACTAANGFENDKSYTIYVEATVLNTETSENKTGSISFGFRVFSMWNQSERTLTSSSTAPGQGIVASTWTAWRGDTLSRTFATIASDDSITKVQFTVKTKPESQEDSSAILAVDSVSGLLYLNGAAPAVAYTATFTIAGVLTVTAATMAQLSPHKYDYDVQVWRGSAVETIEDGTFTVSVDKSRATTPA